MVGKLSLEIGVTCRHCSSSQCRGRARQATTRPAYAHRLKLMMSPATRLGAGSSLSMVPSCTASATVLPTLRMYSCRWYSPPSSHDSFFT